MPFFKIPPAFRRVAEGYERFGVPFLGVLKCF